MKGNQSQSELLIQSTNQAKIDDFIMKKLAKSSSAKYLLQ